MTESEYCDRADFLPASISSMQASDADGAGSSTREVELDFAAPDNRVLICDIDSPSANPHRSNCFFRWKNRRDGPSAFSLKPVFTAFSTQRLLITGNMPGNPASNSKRPVCWAPHRIQLQHH